MLHAHSHRSPSVVCITDSTSFPAGLADTVRLRLLARSLVEQGGEITVLCVRPIDRPCAVENTEVKGTWHGVEFEYTCGETVRHRSFAVRRGRELRGWAVAAARLLQLRAQGRLDCVFAMFPSDEWTPGRQLCLAMARLVHRPVIIDLNERPWTQKQRPRVPERLMSALGGVDGVLAISQYLSAWAAMERARIHRDIALVEIPVVVDVNEQAVDDYPEGPPTVLFAGSPVYDATIDFIILAMCTVWERFPTCRLTLTGVAPDRPESGWLMTRVRGGLVDSRVDVKGYLSRNDLLTEYRAAHALLIPLFNDVRSTARFPTKVGEYLASARPIVTTLVGEMERFLADGVNAYLCAPDDPEAFGTRICDVLDDREAAARVGSAGRRLAETSLHYSLYGPAFRGLIEATRAVR